MSDTLAPIAGAETLSRVAEAVQLARQAQVDWASIGVAQRGRTLRRFRDTLLDNLDSLVECVGQETNKPRLDLVNEVLQGCSLIEHAIKKAPKVLRPRRVGSYPLLHKRAWVEFPPLGVVGVITPWNYPVVLVLSPVIQALITGNTVVLKPSEHAEATAKKLVELWKQSGAPVDAWQCVTGGPNEALALAESGVDKIAFTGGPVGGRAIAQSAAKCLTPVLMELGGVDAMLVARDANVDRAAQGAVWGAFFNCGQSCISVARCYVEAPVADAFIERVLTHARSLRQGLHADASADLGPLRTAAQASRLQTLLADAVAKGADLRLGGAPAPGSELLFPPTVLTNVNGSMRIMNEEAFGPILPIQRIADLEEGVCLANGTPFGLSASVWSSSRKTCRRLASQLHCGAVVANDCLVHFALTQAPFGGVKQSGYGRTHGNEGLLEFCSPKTIVEARLNLPREFHWFPNKGKEKIFARIARLLFRSGFFARFR